jgi:hypothetical protein
VLDTGGRGHRTPVVAMKIAIFCTRFATRHTCAHRVDDLLEICHELKVADAVRA